jgi:predicted protein tyrosine phosphatase
MRNRFMKRFLTQLPETFCGVIRMARVVLLTMSDGRDFVARDLIDCFSSAASARRTQAGPASD